MAYTASMARSLLYVVKFIAADGQPDLATFHDRETAEKAAARIGAPMTMHLVGDDTFPKVKLSDSQKDFLRSFTRHGYSLAPDGRIASSAWHRTCRSLVAMGLVRKTSHHAAGLTMLGLAWAVTL
jgi:hypothetical protein